jgi:hypothetical protein
MVCRLYGDGGDMRRIHLDNMKVYYPRTDYSNLIPSNILVIYSRDAMKFAGYLGQHVVDLTSRL